MNLPDGLISVVKLRRYIKSDKFKMTIDVKNTVGNISLLIICKINYRQARNCYICNENTAHYAVS